MRQIERNTIVSFDLAKRDIRQLQADVLRLHESNRLLVQLIEKLEQRIARLDPKTKVIIEKQAKDTTVVASTKAKRYHRKSCPYGKNIKKAHLLTFKDKKGAQKAGYTACSCI